MSTFFQEAHNIKCDEFIAMIIYISDFIKCLFGVMNGNMFYLHLSSER
jgi:hypothetical protein